MPGQAGRLHQLRLLVLPAELKPCTQAVYAMPTQQDAPQNSIPLALQALFYKVSPCCCSTAGPGIELLGCYGGFSVRSLEQCSVLDCAARHKLAQSWVSGHAQLQPLHEGVLTQNQLMRALLRRHCLAQACDCAAVQVRDAVKL